MPDAPLLPAGTLPAGLERLLGAIDGAATLRTLRHLCAPAFAGRRIGTAGHARAGAWLLAQLRGRGLQTDTVAFTLDTPVLDVYAPPTLSVTGAPGNPPAMLRYRQDFAEHPRSADSPQAVVGIVQRWADHGALDGAWVLLDVVPHGSAFAALTAAAAAQGAVGVLVPQQPNRDDYLAKRIVAGATVALPVLAVRADLLGELAGRTIAAAVPVRPTRVTGQVVLGERTGTDSALAAAPLIVGAHYDGVGDDGAGLRIPGAADNAAGVAVVLELARVLSAVLPPPRRSIIFAAFDGEEVQAQGSQAYVAQLQQHGTTPLVINLDGAARLGEAVWVEAGPGAEVLLAALDQAGQWLSTPLVLGTVSSDNRRYAAAGFPAMGVAVGGQGGHTPADVVARVDPQALVCATRLLLTTIWQLVDGERP